MGKRSRRRGRQHWFRGERRSRPPARKRPGFRHGLAYLRRRQGPFPGTDGTAGLHGGGWRTWFCRQFPCGPPDVQRQSPGDHGRSAAGARCSAEAFEGQGEPVRVLAVVRGCLVGGLIAGGAAGSPDPATVARPCGCGGEPLRMSEGPGQSSRSQAETVGHGLQGTPCVEDIASVSTRRRPNRPFGAPPYRRRPPPPRHGPGYCSRAFGGALGEGAARPRVPAETEAIRSAATAASTAAMDKFICMLLVIGAKRGLRHPCDVRGRVRFVFGRPQE
mmetsp:Transcript_48593/g.141540  ORF Transcript_48593/g.141540 Transcript_48593/m.141540 type:complete len:275 (+) Transcript_48593:1395-2219(+)